MVPVIRNVVLLLAAALALAWWLARVPAQDPAALPTTGQQQTETAIEQHPQVAQPDRPTANKIEATAPLASKGEPPRPAATIETPIARASSVTFVNLESEQRRLTQAIANWRFKHYQRHSSKARIDGEAAYQAYLYVKSCIGSETTATSYNDQLVQLQVLYERNRARVSARELEARLDQLEQGFERCEGLGEKPLETALEWLQLAADLSYLPAQIGFYRELPELLGEERWAVFRRPDLLDLYHQRTPEYLNAALLSGHPDSFRHYAAAIIQGVVFEPDPVLALAFYHAADLAADLELRPLEEADPAARLTAQEIREARLLGEALCEQYCR